MELLAFCEAIEVASTAQALHAGVYPPAADQAGRALQRFRVAILPERSA